MAPAHFRMLNNEFLDKDADMVSEQAPPILLDIKWAIYMAKNIKDTKHTRQISIIIHFVINGEECNFHKTMWYEVDMQLEDIWTKNVRGY